MTEPNVKTDDQLAAAIGRVSMVNSALDFRWNFNWRLVSERVGPDAGWFLWVEFLRPDTETGATERGRSRTEFVQYGATESGVIKTCWLLLELTVRHELMEGFRVDGARVFSPHHRIGALIELARDHEENS